MQRTLHTSLSATLHHKTLLPDGHLEEKSEPIEYDVLGLAAGEYGKICRAGPIDKPHWFVRRWTDTNEARLPGEYISPEEALRALERYVNTHPKFSAG